VLIGHAVAFVLVAAGLLSSTAHLGRPERAWRAFSQWRTSWLSREGVAAVFTFVPWMLHVAGVATGAAWAALVGVLAALCALVTVLCTGMIYQSLPTIRAWHQPVVTPIYLLLSLATGGLLALTLAAFAGQPRPPGAAFTMAALALAAALKLRYWRSVDDGSRAYTAGDATGLARFGEVRVLDPPHTQANFVMREMGYAVARRHSRRLRILTVLLLFVAPLVCAAGLLAGWSSVGAAGASPLPAGIALLAVVAMACGIVMERWLFFAEAQHVVTLFYGARRA
jgi:sulfite dehydrogenase (quinone) subunit SoeC